MSTKFLLSKGARFRVGFGKQIDIWNDPWLPDKIRPFIETIKYPELSLAKVDSLQITEKGEWDLFSYIDQRLIFSIPLSRFEHEDIWTWGRRGMVIIL